MTSPLRLYQLLEFHLHQTSKFFLLEWFLVLPLLGSPVPEHTARSCFKRKDSAGWSDFPDIAICLPHVPPFFFTPVKLSSAWSSYNSVLCHVKSLWNQVQCFHNDSIVNVPANVTPFPCLREDCTEVLMLCGLLGITGEFYWLLNAQTTLIPHRLLPYSLPHCSSFTALSHFLLS